MARGGLILDQFTKEIITLLLDKVFIGLLILLAGYLVSRTLEKFKNELAKLKDFEMMRDKTTLEYLQRQIEELYSPLLGLVQYTDIVYKIEQDKPLIKAQQSEEEYQRELSERQNYFYEEFYLPLNTQIADLIRTKIYLLDSDEIPQSFQQFLQHAAEFSALHKLWKDKNLSSEHIKGVDWPEAFDEDIASALRNLRKQYNRYLIKMEISAPNAVPVSKQSSA